jgi:hypothetical protein
VNSRREVRTTMLASNSGYERPAASSQAIDIACRAYRHYSARRCADRNYAAHLLPDSRFDSLGCCDAFAGLADDASCRADKEPSKVQRLVSVLVGVAAGGDRGCGCFGEIERASRAFLPPGSLK